MPNNKRGRSNNLYRNEISIFCSRINIYSTDVLPCIVKKTKVCLIFQMGNSVPFKYKLNCKIVKTLHALNFCMQWDKTKTVLFVCNEKKKAISVTQQSFSSIILCALDEFATNIRVQLYSQCPVDRLKMSVSTICVQVFRL